MIVFSEGITEAFLCRLIDNEGKHFGMELEIVSYFMEESMEGIMAFKVFWGIFGIKLTGYTDSIG